MTKTFVNILQEVEVLEMKICNLCGADFPGKLSESEETEGYYSFGTHIDDKWVEFDLCSKCLNNLMAGFEHPVDVYE